MGKAKHKTFNQAELDSLFMDPFDWPAEDLTFETIPPEWAEMPAINWDFDYLVEWESLICSGNFTDTLSLENG